jgi:hypothetical protein
VPCLSASRRLGGDTLFPTEPLDPAGFVHAPFGPAVKDAAVEIGMPKSSHLALDPGDVPAAEVFIKNETRVVKIAGNIHRFRACASMRIAG